MEQLGDRIAELAAHIQAADHRLLEMIREFDRGSGWAEQGARSCAHWLSWRIGLDLGAAREKVRVARALENLPRLSEALRKGEISYSKVRAVTRIANPENEKDLLTVALGGTASQVETVVRAWRKADPDIERASARAHQRERYLQTYTDDDGMLVVRGRLPAEVGVVLVKALEAAGEKLYRRRKDGRVAPGGYRTRGSHRSGRARLAHPAPLVYGFAARQ